MIAKSKVKKITKADHAIPVTDLEMVLVWRKTFLKLGLKPGQIRRGNKFLAETEQKEVVEVLMFDSCLPLDKLGESDFFVWHRHLDEKEAVEVRLMNGAR